MWTAFKALSWGGKLGIAFSILTMIFAAAAIGYVKGSAKADIKISKAIATKEKMRADYERRLSEKKTQIVIKWVDRVKKVEVQKKIYVNVADKVPSAGNLSKGWVSVHDAAAKLKEIDEQTASDATPSKYTDVDALKKVTNNYTEYHKCAANLNALQDIIRAHNESIEEANKKRK